MNVRNTSVGLVIVAVLSVALALWYLGHSTTRGHATAPSLQTEGGIAAAEATKKIDAQKPRIDQVAAGSTSVWSGAESYEAYERARNLNDLVNDLKAAAEGGDPTSQVVYAKALSECAMLSADPFYLDNVPIMNEQLKKNGRGIASTKLVNRYRDRCAELASTRKISVAEINAMWRKAEASGEPVAVAMAFARTAPGLKPDERKDGILEILRSGNPYAINEIADLEGQARDSSYGSYAGTTEDKYAWQFAACDLGMDCSSDSYIVVRSCLVLTLCGEGDYRTIVRDSVLSPGQYQHVLDLERQILIGLKTGDLESVFFAHQ